MVLKKICIIGLIAVGGVYFISKINAKPIEYVPGQIEKYYDKNSGELEKYISNENLVSKDKGLEFSIKEIMLDDRQIIVSMIVDYSDPKWILKNKQYLGPSFPTITIGDYVFTGQAGGYDLQVLKGKQIANIMLKTSLTSIDTNNDGYSDKDVELLDIIEQGKEYDLKIEFNQLDIGETGNWIFNTKIDASNIINDTKSYKVDKAINIDENEYKGELRIDEVRVSPFSVKVKYNYDLYDEISVEKRRDPNIIIKDEIQNELNAGSGEDGKLENRKWNMVYEYLLEGEEKSINIIPASYVSDKQKLYGEGIVKIDL